MSGSMHGGGARYVLVKKPEAEARQLEFRYFGPSDAPPGNLILYVDIRERRISSRRIEHFDADAVIQETDEGTPQLYEKIWPGLPPAGHEDEHLIRLGRAMANNHASGWHRPDWSNLPAAYTYFGQFIAHDISHLDWVKKGEDSFDAVTPALDLSSLFGHPDRPLRSGKSLVGETSTGSRRDLARFPCGRPDVADTRNDANLGLSQIHVLIALFHEALINRFGLSDADARLETKRHLQYVVLNDYLPRIVGRELVEEILRHGRALFNPPVFFTPVEFSAAAFQFGHAMIRHSYAPWKADGLPASPTNLMQITYVGGDLESNASEERAIPGDWLMPWDHMLPQDVGNGATIHAAVVTSRMAAELGEVDPMFVQFPLGMNINTPEAPKLLKVNLAAQTLLRCKVLEIADAQVIATVAQVTLSASTVPRIPIPTLTPDELIAALDLSSGGLRNLLEVEFPHFLTGTPLWLYTLLEARHHNATGHLGPLAGRIIAETLHAAIASDPDSILVNCLNLETVWPKRVSQGRDFDLWAMWSIAMSEQATRGDRQDELDHRLHAL